MPKLYEDKPIKTDEKPEWFVKAVQNENYISIIAVDKNGDKIKIICSIEDKGLYIVTNAEIDEYKDPYPVDKKGRIKIINS